MPILALAWVIAALIVTATALEDEFTQLFEKLYSRRLQIPNPQVGKPKIPTKPPPERRTAPERRTSPEWRTPHKGSTRTESRKSEPEQIKAKQRQENDRGRTAIKLTDYKKWTRENKANDQCRKTKKRIGGERDGDGGKWVCQALIPPAGKKCLILSIGSGHDFSWETEMHSSWPHCKIHVFDGTNYGLGAPKNPPTFLTFHSRDFKIGINEELDSALEGGTQLDILKIDCEGCEYSSLMPFLYKVTTSQVLVELHGCIHRSYAKNLFLMNSLSGMFSIFSEEPNRKHSDGTCIEFGLARKPSNETLHPTI